MHPMHPMHPMHLMRVAVSSLACSLTGGLVGFLLFITLLESKGMRNVLYREGVFVPRNLVKYVRSPFNSTVLWHPALWKHNWIVMTVCGGIIGTMLGNATRFIYPA